MTAKKKTAKSGRSSQGRAAPAKKKPAAKPLQTSQGKPRKARLKKLEPTATAIRQVSDWILEGHSEPTIVESIRTIFRATNGSDFIAAAFGYLSDLVEARPETRLAWHIAARRELHRRTFEIHDFKTCRDILRDMAQLEGLYPGSSGPKRSPRGAETDQDETGAGAKMPTAAGFPVQ